MMGYRLPDRTIVLEGFEGDFEGLEVTCTRNTPMTVYMALDGLWTGGDRPEAYLLFGDEIIECWNYEDAEGTPIEATGVALQALPPDMSALIVSAWIREVTDVPAPLELPSTNGVVEMAPPMDLGSMSTPN